MENTDPDFFLAFQSLGRFVLAGIADSAVTELAIFNMIATHVQATGSAQDFLSLSAFGRSGLGPL